MPTSPFPSDELGAEQRLAFALAGTVALPSPFPASGQLSLGTTAGGARNFVSETSDHYLRLVHVISPKLVITRFLALEDVRAVSLPGKTLADPRQSLTRSDSNFSQVIDKAKTQLTKGPKAGLNETVVFPDVIIYVPETAPVLLRLAYEFGVTAAESVSNLSLFTLDRSVCSPL